MDENLTPEPILSLGLGFWASKTLLSAVELGVFTELAGGPLRQDELNARIGLHPRGSRDFLDALVSLGMLDRQDDRYAAAIASSSRRMYSSTRCGRSSTRQSKSVTSGIERSHVSWRLASWRVAAVPRASSVAAGASPSSVCHTWRYPTARMEGRLASRA